MSLTNQTTAVRNTADRNMADQERNSSEAISVGTAQQPSEVSEGGSNQEPLTSGMKQIHFEISPSGSEELPISREVHAQRGRMELASDYQVFKAIDSKLVRKLNQGAAKIIVDLLKGHCVLHGEVRCFYEMQLAQESALRTSGVRSVENKIAVQTKP